MNHLNYTTNRRNFKQLTKTNRIEIETLLREGFSKSKIAKKTSFKSYSIY